MRFLSRLKEYGSESLSWAKANPKQAISRSVISILAGVGLGLLLAPVSVSVGIVCSVGFGVGAAIALNNDGIKAHQGEIFKTANTQLVESNAKTALELSIERTSKALNETALNKNAQTISDKDAEILKLKTEILQAKANTINLAPPVSVLNSVSSSNEIKQASNQGMFKNSGIQKRARTNASNVDLILETKQVVAESNSKANSAIF